MNELGVLAAAGEAQFHHVASDGVHFIFIKLEVVWVKRRKDGVTHDGLVVDGRRHVPVETAHGASIARNVANPQQGPRIEVAVVFHPYLRETFREKLSLAASGNDIGRWHEHENGVALVYLDESARVGIKLF